MSATVIRASLSETSAGSKRIRPVVILARVAVIRLREAAPYAGAVTADGRSASCGDGRHRCDAAPSRGSGPHAAAVAPGGERWGHAVPDSMTASRSAPIVDLANFLRTYAAKTSRERRLDIVCYSKYAAAPMPAANALHQLDGATLADRAYDAIREAIISGELSSQQKITERGLAVLLAVSPTPVREALRRLEQDGLVQRDGTCARCRSADFAASSTQEIRVAEGALRAVGGRPGRDQRHRGATRPDGAHPRRRRPGAGPAAGRARGSGASPATHSSLLLAITWDFHAELNAACNNPVILRLLRTVEAFKLATISSELTAEIETVGGAAASARGTTSTGRCSRRCVAGDAATAERLMTEHSRWRLRR